MKANWTEFIIINLGIFLQLRPTWSWKPPGIIRFLNQFAYPFQFLIIPTCPDQSLIPFQIKQIISLFLISYLTFRLNSLLISNINPPIWLPFLGQKLKTIPPKWIQQTSTDCPEWYMSQQNALFWNSIRFIEIYKLSKKEFANFGK